MLLLQEILCLSIKFPIRWFYGRKVHVHVIKHRCGLWFIVEGRNETCRSLDSTGFWSMAVSWTIMPHHIIFISIKWSIQNPTSSIRFKNIHYSLIRGRKVFSQFIKLINLDELTNVIFLLTFFFFLLVPSYLIVIILSPLLCLHVFLSSLSITKHANDSCWRNALLHVLNWSLLLQSE